MGSKNSFHIVKSHKKNAPWIVLINGLFAGMESWNFYAENLKEYFNVLKYDSPGQGSASELTSLFSLDDQVDFLKTLLEDLGIHKPILLGLSNGGRIALRFSERYQGSVTSVFAADTYVKLTFDIELKLNSWLLANDLGGSELRFLVSSPWIFGKSLINEKPRLIKYYQKQAKKSCPVNANFLIKAALEVTELDISKINCPVHLFVGDEDILTVLSIHQEMLEKIQDCSLTIVKGGHASLLEFPDNLEFKIMPILKQYCVQQNNDKDLDKNIGSI